MSKSAHRTHRAPATNKRTKEAEPAATPAPSADHWSANGINYGPAISALHELAAWAFDLAAHNTADWPAGKRRVANARRFVLSRLRGRRLRAVPCEDVMFTAGLLARIFDADLRLSMTEMISIFDQLGLPTEVVPRVAPAPARDGASSRASAMPFRPRTTLVTTHPGPVDYYDAFLRFKNAA